MLASIALVLSVEMIRDGGSLAAVFQGADGAVYSLFLPLRHRTLPSGVFERLGYDKPLVVEQNAGIEMEISWSRAAVLINQIRPLIRTSEDHRWLNAIDLVVESEGALPSEVERFLAPLKLAT